MPAKDQNAETRKTKIRMLSIDGGGIRGIIPATIMIYLEKQIRKETKNENAKVGEYFDMISGTSTGGILACLYLTPESPGSTKAKYTAEEALKLYLNHGTEIFSKKFWERITHYKMWNENYKADSLQKLLDNFFGDTKLSELIRPCLITSYDFFHRRATFFNSVDARCRAGDVRDFYVKNITRATSAAPTYFEPARITSIGGSIFNLIDGGVFVNNPSMSAYSEARTTNFSEDPYIEQSCKSKKPDKPTAVEMFHVSVGTGSEARRIEFNTLKDAGLVSWLPYLIDIMMSASSETVDYHLRKIYDTLDDKADREDYMRLEASRGEASAEMDCVTLQNLEALHHAGNRYIYEHQEDLNTIAKKLVKYC
jgi:patatin-like phospholipase/acyl hydrolase